MRRHVILSVSKDRRLYASRNAVLTGSGYGVAPALSVRDAVAKLRRGGRQMYCMLLLGHTLSAKEKREIIRHSRGGESVPTLCIYNAHPDNCGADLEVQSLAGPRQLLACVEKLCQPAE